MLIVGDRGECGPDIGRVRGTKAGKSGGESIKGLGLTSSGTDLFLPTTLMTTIMILCRDPVGKLVR